MMLMISQIDDRALRGAGLISMVCGAILLYVLR
jgi:uncharacterized protein YjeT (DUF2065 family)